MLATSRRVSKLEALVASLRRSNKALRQEADELRRLVDRLDRDAAVRDSRMQEIQLRLIAMNPAGVMAVPGAGLVAQEVEPEELSQPGDVMTLADRLGEVFGDALSPQEMERRGQAYARRQLEQELQEINSELDSLIR